MFRYTLWAPCFVCPLKHGAYTVKLCTGLQPRADFHDSCGKRATTAKSEVGSETGKYRFSRRTPCQDRLMDR